MASDQHDFSDYLQRYRNLLEAAEAGRCAPAKIALDQSQSQRLVQLVGPLMAVINAAGTCAELLAVSAGVGEDQIDHARPNQSEAKPPSVDDLDFVRSAEDILARLLELHQVAVDDIAELATRAVSGTNHAAATDAADGSSGDDLSGLGPGLDHWIMVGTNPVYAAVSNAKVIALVYETGEEVGTDENGEPTVAEGGWFWFPSDGPDRHREVPVGEPAAERGSLDPVHDAALDAAAEEIESYLGRRHKSP